jgi:predicted aspartyl protease
LPAGAVAADPVAAVPFTLSGGQIHFSAQVNDTRALTFMLDTGFSMTMLRPELAQELKLRRTGEITVEGIAGDERAPTFEGARFDIGGARYSARRIGAMSSTRRKRDGIIGAGLFRQYVVVVDFAAKTLSLYAPSNLVHAGGGEVVPMRFRRSTPIIDAVVNVPGRAAIPAALELDTGCDSGVCLGSEFTATHKLLDAEQTRAGEKVGVGGGAKTRSGRLPQLQIGALKIERPETDFFLEGSPVDRGLAGHLGMEVLRQFRRVTFDYSRQRLVLERGN